jgi:hypothetical protein
MKNWKDKIVDKARSFDEVRKLVDTGYGQAAGNSAKESQRAKAVMEDPTAPKLMKQTAERRKARADSNFAGFGHAAAENANKKMRKKQEGK